MGLGILYESLKKYDKAKEYYRKVLKINPRFAPAQNNLAYLYADAGEIWTKPEFSSRRQRTIPDDPHISDTLDGSITKEYLHPGDHLPEGSKRETPDSPVIRYHLGMAYFKNGDKEMRKLS